MKFIDIGKHPSYENQQIFNTHKYNAYNSPFKKTSNCRFNKVYQIHAEKEREHIRNDGDEGMQKYKQNAK